MSLVIDADGKYLRGSGGSFGANLTELTIAVWVRSIDYNTYGVFAAFGANATWEQSAQLGRQPSYYCDGFMYPGNLATRIANTLTLSQENTNWHLLVVTFKNGAALKTYVDNVLRVNDTTNAALSNTFTGTMDEVAIGRGLDYALNAWNARSYIAHVAMWAKELTSTQVTELWNGGTSGNGKNPQAVQAADLKFYAALTTDATVQVGGISLTNTGSAAFNSGVNPNVDAGGPPDTTAPVLSSPVGTATAPTTATVGATTDEGNGTLYAVVTTSATQPSVAQIKAGQTHTGSAAPWGGSVAVTSTGAKTLGATGLTPATGYYGHLVHDDAAVNPSNRVTSALFTTPQLPHFDLSGADYDFADNTGSTLASEAVTFWAHHPTTGDLVVKITGYSTDASGFVPTVASASLTAATAYRLNYEFASGKYGVLKISTAA